MIINYNNQQNYKREENYKDFLNEIKFNNASMTEFIKNLENYESNYDEFNMINIISIEQLEKYTIIRIKVDYLLKIENKIKYKQILITP